MKILKVYNPSKIDRKANIDGNEILIPSGKSIELAEVTVASLKRLFGDLELSELKAKKVKATKLGKAKGKK